MIWSAGIEGGSFEMPEERCEASGVFGAGTAAGFPAGGFTSGCVAGSYCGVAPGIGPTSCAAQEMANDRPASRTQAIGRARTGRFVIASEISRRIFVVLFPPPGAATQYRSFTAEQRLLFIPILRRAQSDAPSGERLTAYHRVH